MNKSIFILILVMVLSSSLVSAQYIFKQGESIDLKVPCYNNDNFCGSSATCNITILYPNSTALIKGKSMTNQGYSFNYTLSSSQTQIMGEYSSFIVCQDGIENGTSDFVFEITPSGFVANNGNWNMVIIIGLIGIPLVFIALSFLFSREMRMLKTFLIMSALGCIILASQYIILMVKTGNPFDFSLYDKLNAVLLTVSIVVFSVFGLYYLVVFTKETFHNLDNPQAGVETE